MICPLCRQPCDTALFALSSRLDERFAARLAAQHPEWHEREGVCPRCLYDAVQEARRGRAPHSLQSELQTPYPVYAPDDLRLLPLAVRLRAHPGYAGRGVTIAFLDSGFYPHPDLTRPRDRIRRHVDATGETPREAAPAREPRVEQWHGTMTSCVGAGNGFMAQGLFPSLAPRSNVVLVKTGSARSRRIHDRDILRALQWVVAHGARDGIRVVNISLGGDRGAAGQLSDLDGLVEEAVALGMVVVCAAGNGAHAGMDSPATAPSAITVGGMDDQNTLERCHWQMYRSSYGTAADGSPKPDLVAPAIWLPAPMLPASETHSEGMLLWQLARASDAQFENLLAMPPARAFFKTSTLRLPIEEIRQKIRGRMIDQKFVHAHYQHVDGSSFAAPIVASVAAQMLEANPSLTPAQVKAILAGTAEPLAGAAAEPQGHGVLSAARAVAGALRAPGGALAGFPPSPAREPWGITFTYCDDEAESVSVIGTFNDWDPRALRMSRVAPGIWQATLPPLDGTRHAYKFFVNGARWSRDPENGEMDDDGCGGYNSLL